MAKPNLILGSLIFVSFFALFSCNKTIKTSNTVGDWENTISKKMGGYTISQTSILSIIRKEAGVYEYLLKSTTTDEMYSGVPKTQISTGKFEEYIKDNKWVFEDGDFGERGAYIQIPEDQWDNYKPEQIEIQFASGRGSTMIFSRN